MGMIFAYRHLSGKTLATIAALQAFATDTSSFAHSADSSRIWATDLVNSLLIIEQVRTAYSDI